MPVLQPLQDEGDRLVGDVYADPLAAEPLGDRNRGAAAAVSVEDDVSLVGGSPDDAFEQGFGLLGGIAEAFGAHGL